MPTYQYACKNCGQQLEVVQSFSDDALTTCPECQGALRKVWGSVGVVFKGSGFYRNDSRGGSSSSLAANSSGDSAKNSSDSTSTTSSSDSSSTSSAAPAAASSS
ncbi:FmdB family zinc ribbon protein [Cumulibacter soli]|uniref:FmdB family zinc ribbon protein n=1 Tax=Cumulibacter soli TaxID=2546344 RepID=UPI001067394F|nr:FmdB family zinc ribbon protein [Cumulibacter soli]